MGATRDRQSNRRGGRCDVTPHEPLFTGHAPPVRSGAGSTNACMDEAWKWDPEHTDRLVTALALAIVVTTWVKDRQLSERLADVEVPHGIQLPVLMFALVGRRMRDRQWAEAGKSLNDLGEILAKRMGESDERQKQLLDLQASLERLAQDSTARETRLVALQEDVQRYTKWLLRLTVIVAAIGLASIVATIVVTATH